jgi:hypothetical protein
MRTFLLMVLLSFCGIAPVCTAGDPPYFPPEFDSAYYPRHLKAMNEPSLFQRRAEPGFNAVRFTWLRSFHDPIVVRVQLTERGADVRTVRLKRKGQAVFETVLDRTVETDMSLWSEITNSVARMGFWEMPTEDAVTGFDGARWILESVSSGRYKIVDRWGPTYDADERKLQEYVATCKRVLKVGGIDLEKDRVY